VPRREALVRGGVVAALLCLAAAVLRVEPAPPAARHQPNVGAPPGTVGYALRLPDPWLVGVVRQGQRLDVLAAEGDAARVVVSDVLVLRAGGGAPGGALLYLAVTQVEAARLAATAPEARLSVTVRSP
jgi:hypothetical protein